MLTSSRTSPLRTLVVDDTALYRRAVSQALSRLPGVEVVGTAANGRLALERMGEFRPHMITLDIEMPELNGIEVLEAMSSWPEKPVVIVLSSLSRQGSSLTMRALELGAFEFVTKPEVGSLESCLDNLTKQLGAIVEAYSGKALAAGPAAAPVSASPNLLPPNLLPPARKGAAVFPPRLIALGVSTGGPQALASLLVSISSLPIPLLIVQHMPALFTGALAESLQRKCRLKVKEAEQGEIAKPGCVYIAPGGRQMKIKSSPGGEVLIQITDDPAENHCRPAVDYLFRSVATCFPGAAVGVILTGMGSDGAQGLKMLRNSGCHTLAQDEASSVVFGMPRAAIAADAVEEVVSLSELPAALIRAVKEPRRT
ncbi:MAG: chemotaxis response regulator protein-glutamate methylesterase [Bryobacter sp.]|nr:chemotaxis response regulator protein-glutamate methylesterase [Bryobacter sp. CoA8 C33]